MSKSPKAQIVCDLLERFPKAPILTLAKKAYKENPTVFKDIEDARNHVRFNTGQQKGRGYGSRDKTHHRPIEYKYNPFQLPESHADDFTPFEIKDSRTLILSDAHFPYQDNKAIELALNYGIEKKANCILLNGDIIDFAPISRHEKDWRQRTVAQEFDSVRQFLKVLRGAFPSARIVYKLGNHDERWEKWLVAKAPELLDCSDFELEILLRFGEYRVEVVKDKRPIKLGKLTVLHGHELAGGSGGVNPARSAFLKTLDTVLIGHFHKRSNNDGTTLGGDYISANSVGCLCGLHPKYMPINAWCHGFAYVEQEKSGDFMLENLKIIKGKIYK